jgi:23S rRNA pseudouridine2605 synthase
MTESTRKPLSLKRESLPHAGIEERLQKVLANAGLGSRRALDERIAAGEIRVNTQVATPGTTVRGGDRVEIDGKAFIAVPSEPEEAQVLIYHKPEAEVTTHDDPEGRRTVFERLPKLKGARWVSIGRLDINTTGLLLITTDGELAHAMMHPSKELAREYVCRVHGEVSEEMLARLRAGVELEDGPARFDELHVIHLGESHSWFRVVLHEGRNREVRRLWESQGVTVSRLKRIRYGSVELPRELRRGHWRALDAEAYRNLRRELELGDAPMTLTLQAVIGVRRAAKSAAEYRPAGRSEGWVAGRADEARELRAFDFIRDEGKGRPGGRGNKGKRFGGEGRGKPGGGAGRRRGAAPGHEVAGGPGVWQPSGAEGGKSAPFSKGRRRPGAPGSPGTDRAGPRSGTRNPGAPGERTRDSSGPRRGPGGRGAPGGERRGPPGVEVGSGADRRGPRGKRPPFQGERGGPSGNHRDNSSPRGAFASRDNARSGSRGAEGGPRQDRGQPKMPYGFPSDHAYAQRFRDVDGNIAPREPGANRRKPPHRGPKPPRRDD